MYIKRYLDLNRLLEKKSFFLFGPRATGKTSLIKEQLNEQFLRIDLLKSDLFLRLSSNPWEIEDIINAHPSCHTVVIDEIQKIPLLLNEVHRFIEDRKIKFILTGSSARKLKQADVNLLGGRAWEADLFPFIMNEIPNFSLERYLLYGGLPSVYLSEEPREELIAYVDIYLKEEIQAEGLIRKLQSFSKFLTVSALTSGNILNFSSLSNDVGIPATTVREYYQILQDTLVGFLLPAWTKSIKRKALSTAKFYYFDVGVMHQLAGIKNIDPHSDLFGKAFEQFIAMELRAYISYNRKHIPLSYWSSKHGHEVDFIVGDDIAIEVKTAKSISGKHLVGLRALQEENICKQYFVISFDKIHRIVEGIEIIYWKDFLKNLWEQSYF